jgi:hypothetical protein
MRQQAVGRETKQVSKSLSHLSGLTVGGAHFLERSERLFSHDVFGREFGQQFVGVKRDGHFRATLFAVASGFHALATEAVAAGDARHCETKHTPKIRPGNVCVCVNAERVRAYPGC